MAIEAEFIRQSRAPVIVAGSTASIAATMTLMEALRGRANSAIVLHGLDGGMDAASWAALGDHPEHPQHGLHQLLTRLGVRRESVRDLSKISRPPQRHIPSPWNAAAIGTPELPLPWGEGWGEGAEPSVKPSKSRSVRKFP